MDYNQEIIEDGTKRTLAEFATEAITLLEEGKNGINEVVLQANSITELEHNCMVHPETAYPLPTGYSYRFSGFWGQVIGIVKNT
jgi:hypothetical protein